MKLRALAASMAVVGISVSLAACSSDEDPVRTAAGASSAESAAASPSAQPSEAAPAPAESAAPAPAESAAPAPALPPGSTGISNGLQPAPPAAPVPTLPPVALDQESVSEQGLAIKVVSFRDVETPAGAPGEIGGPGVAFDITVRNNGSASVDLSNVVADLRSGPELVPVLRADREPTKPFAGTLAPGATASATYAFTLPEADRSNVTLYLILTASTPTAVFTGSVQ